MQKARHHPGLLRRALTACRRVVSGSLSSPCRGSSHLSLALLGSLSVAREYLALRDGPRGFRPASTCRVLLRCRTGTFPVRLRASHPLWRTIPGPSAWVACLCVRSYNPTRTRIRKLMLVESGLDSSSGPPEHDRTGGLAGKSHGTCSKSGLDG
jgi:hypothetical protein